MSNDSDDLRAFVTQRSQDAFTRIVHRHGPAIYASCQRQLRDVTLAEDATQATFLVLVQRADRISPDAVLAGWLFNVARYVCTNIRRGEMRRMRNEQAAMNQKSEDTAVGAPTLELEAALDDAIANLRPADRDLILLRFARQMELPEISAECGIEPAAARKRISRAIARLREHFLQRGLIGQSQTAEVILVVLAGGQLSDRLLSLCTNIQSSAPSASTAALAKTVVTQMRNKTMKVILAASVAVSGLCGSLVVAAAMSSTSTEQANFAVVENEPLQAPPTIEDAQKLAATHDYAGAIEKYADFLRTLSPEEYRDKKDFEWILDEAKTPADVDALAAVVSDKLETRGDDSIIAWRLHRLNAAIAAKKKDTAAERASLQLAIDAYPAEVGEDPARHSSLQHMYNQVAMLIAAKDRAAARTYLIDRFDADPRFVYIFVLPWRQLAASASQPAEFQAFGNAILEAYDRKIAAGGENRELLATYRQTIARELAR